MEMICAFSSDSRELYKADIYRALALPRGHILHFRYKKKYVDSNLSNSPDSLKDKEVAIFFMHGNSLEENASFQSSLFPIRKGTITESNYSDDTGVFHVYFSLGDFCNIKIDSSNSAEKMPPTNFLSKLTCTVQEAGNSWHSRILEIKDFFPDITFFHFHSIVNKSEKPVRIQPRGVGSSCYYELEHGSLYYLNVRVANPNSTDTKIKIEDSSGDITLNCVNPFETSIQFDDHSIPLSIKSLSDSEQASVVSFIPLAKQPDGIEHLPLAEYATGIEISLKRPSTHFFKFFLGATGALLGLGVMRFYKPEFQFFSFDGLIILGGATLSGVSLAYLYSKFGKK